MRIRAALDGVDISYAVLIESLAIRQDSREAISTAEITLRDTAAMSARYDLARYDQDRYASAIEIREWQQLSIYDQDTLQILFAGFVLSVGREQESNRVRYKLAASDWGILFERTLITHTWPNGTPDSTIVADALALVPELTAGTIVTQVTNLGAIEAKDQRIRDLLDEVCELTGSEWSVSYDGKLNYYRIGSVVAPFALSDAPNGTTTMPYQIENYENDFSDAANRVLALGGLTDAGEIRSTANEPASQAQYGVLSATVIDRNITDVQTAAVWAQTEVAQRAFPKPTITAALYQPGLARGMTVGVTSVGYGISASLVLRSLQLAIAAPDRQRAGGPGHIVKYTAVLGSRPPDLVYRLRRMQRKPPDRTIVPPTPVVPGSITGGSLAAGLGLIYIVAAKPTVWTQYPADATFFNTTDRKLYRRIAGNDWTAVVPTGDIEGQIQTHQLAPGSVTTTILADGSVVTAKIPTGAITAPQLGPGAVTGPAIQASAVTADKIAANAIEATHISAGSVTATALAVGSVTANAIAANAVYTEALQANSVTAIAIAANAVIAGKIAALAVLAGNIAADAVTAGTIAAAAVQVGDLAAGAVTAGTIAANAVTSATIAAGAITADHIQAGVIDSTKLNTTELKVGGGGSKPGKINVYDASGTILVAQIGALDGGQYGGAFKVFAAAGTGYADAKIKCDTSGNLYITNANFSITAGGYSIYTNPTTFDSSYGSLALVAEGGSDKAVHVSRGMVIYGSGATVGALVRHPSVANAAQLVLNHPAGGYYLLLDGNTAVCRADGGFAVVGHVGLGFHYAPQTIPAGRSLTVVGGLITGFSAS